MAGSATENPDPPSKQPTSAVGGDDRSSFTSRIGWSAVVEILEILSGTLIFVVLAGVLTTNEYGIMTGIAGAVMPALSLSNLGTHILLMRRAARGEDLAEAWNKALTLGFFGPALAVIVMLTLHPVLYPQGNVPWVVYALFVLAGLPFMWLSKMVVYLPVGLGDMKSAAVVRALTFGCRLIALGWFVTFSSRSLVAWAVVHALSFAAAGLVGVISVGRKFGLAPGLATDLKSDIRDGTPFSLNGATENIFDGADRVLLVRYELEADAGVYGLGGRITQFGYAPIRMLLRTYDADLFKAGGRSLTAAFQVTKKMFLPGLGLALGTAAVFWVCAPLVPLVLGANKWSEAVPAIRLLAVLPVIRSVQYLLGNTLSASDLQQWRFGGTAVAAVFNIVLNVLLLPTGTWRTAVATTFASEVLLVTLLAGLVWFRLQRESQEFEEEDVESQTQRFEE